MIPSPTIRLFVSSTFKDLKAERDALQRDVFPRLKQLCLSKGLRFQAIDLRWGISQEAGRDNQTMRICLRELRRCQQDRPKPNFLVLLGDRYGWRPLPEIILATLFEKLEMEVRAKDAKAAKLLTDSYRRDDNAVPPIYELQPRGDLEHWHDTVGTPLRAALEIAAAALPDEPGLAKLAIGLGATHQEILHGALKLQASDAREHVHAFIRQIQNLSDAPLPQDFVDPDANAQTQGLLGQLKGQLVEHLGQDNVHPFTMEWQTGGADDASGFTEASLKQFCDDVYQALSTVIEKQIARLEAVAPEAQEDQAHQDFGRERCRRFVGRRESLERIAEYLESVWRQASQPASDGGIPAAGGSAGSGVTGPQGCAPPQLAGKPLAVIGPSGSGKSALMAKAMERLQESEVRGQGSRTIARYIGATPASSDLVQLLRNLVAEIRRRYPAPVRSPGFSRSGSEPGPDAESEPPEGGTPNPPTDSEIPFEYNPLVSAFHEALQRPTADRPLFLFLDALDQLTASNNAHSLAWLPGSLNPHVRLIVSAALPTPLDRRYGVGGQVVNVRFLARLFVRAGPVRYAVATDGDASGRLGRLSPSLARPPKPTARSRFTQFGSKGFPCLSTP